jgi:hypothetical protein
MCCEDGASFLFGIIHESSFRAFDIFNTRNLSLRSPKKLLTPPEIMTRTMIKFFAEKISQLIPRLGTIQAKHECCETMLISNSCFGNAETFLTQGKREEGKRRWESFVHALPRQSQTRAGKKFLDCLTRSHATQIMDRQSADNGAGKRKEDPEHRCGSSFKLSNCRVNQSAEGKTFNLIKHSHQMQAKRMRNFFLSLCSFQFCGGLEGKQN